MDLAPKIKSSFSEFSKLSREGQAELIRILRANQAKIQPLRKLYSYYPDDGPLRRELYPRHMEFFAAGGRHELLPTCPDDCDGSPHRDRLALCANRVGKALRHGTSVATPSGWKSIESLKIGDFVIAGDGSITSVTGVFPQGIKRLYRLTFDVGETIDCCADHLWLYQHPAARYPYRGVRAGLMVENKRFGEWSVGSTGQILRQLGSAPGPRMRAVMPTSEPWQIPPRPVPLDPYLVGLLIGDGGLTDYVRFTSADPELIEALASSLPESVTLKALDHQSWVIAAPGGKGHSKGKVKGQTNPVRNSLADLGLMGCKSDTKFVPDIYLLNDAATRRAVLQGLMDTDGSIVRTGAMEFSSVSHRLAMNVQFIVHSLGGKATIEQRQTHYTHKGERRAGQPSYRVRIRLNECPFRLARKAARWNTRHNTANRVLHRIEPIEADYATCIEVAHPSHTFVTAHGIVTHNTESMGGYEVAIHLTGRYPRWWQGARWSRPIDCWAAGKNNESTRDIVQAKLFGKVKFNGREKNVDGTGLIPHEDIGAVTWKRGVANLIDTAKIRHSSGGWSEIGLKSYEQGRGSFEGTERDLIWCDEEPPIEVYEEAGIRLMTRSGHFLCTFTPLEGMSHVVLTFIPGGSLPVRVEERAKWLMDAIV